MTWALVTVVGSLLAWSVTLTIWWRGAIKEKDHLRDLYEANVREFGESMHDLEVANHNVSLLRDELDATKEILKVVQQQRNDAMETARDYFVQRLQNTGSSEAARIVADLLASPINELVLPKAKRSDDPKDGLINPFANAGVQPAAGTVADPNRTAR